ncbi:MAG: inositol-3-phosphate synthase [Candidatus Aenigmarchaeota archaeon]|nr:inositol-3-phosphate synthase [Candidatus Aenigmarchaeota archaeon]
MIMVIRVAIAGVGNCASSLIQGLFYYKNVKSNGETVPGLMHNVLGGYKISDIEIVAAFDIDARKVGKDVSEAIFSEPNCTKVFADVPKLGVNVDKGPVLDGVAEHMEGAEKNSFVIAEGKEADVVSVLKKSKVDVLVNYMPVGSEKAAKFYAQASLDANCAFVNCMPVFISSNSEWANKFREKNLPIIGDDVKSQIGATIVNRSLAKLFEDRGVKIDRMYQLNVGGNTDFKNMLDRARLKSKKISKTESVQSNMPKRLEDDDIHIGPSDYVPWLNDNKIAFIRIEGRNFGDVPLELELRLSVEDSPNSAGVVIDAIRCCKMALDRKIPGPLTAASAYFCKHPAQQFPDDVARSMLEQFISAKQQMLAS